MEDMEDIRPLPIDIHSVMFRPDDTVEITYAEKSELTPKVSVIKTILLDRESFKEDIKDIEENVFDLIDEGLLALRNPPDEERRSD